MSLSDFNYVNRAEKVIEGLKNNRGKLGLKTNQIRKILSEVNKIKNRVEVLTARGEIKDDRLPEKILSDLQALKVKVIYQYGRGDYNVKNFVEKSELLKEIDRIGTSKKAFELFSSYVEALVAYHKYEGGE
jgi:CRISPR-associated protein Csm2